MRLNWNGELLDRVRNHIARVLEHPPADGIGTVIRNHDALPLYSDVSGSLLLTTGGRIIFYSPETEQVAEQTDPAWQIIAAVSGAELYPDLLALLPERPAHAASCPDCQNAGKLFKGRVYCGRCHGLGWIEPT